nr:DUF3572 domain-containing protein [Pacificimonas flava]
MKITNASNAATDPQVIALLAIGHVMGDDRLAGRFLDLSGIGVQDLRESVASPAIGAAALDFLAAHEPDLRACASALGLPPEDLIAARDALHPDGRNDAF